MYDSGDKYEFQVPLSGGFPPLVRWLLVATVVLVGIVAGMVLASAGHGHIWPASDTQRLKLD
jgi:hypothetical protein